jgi:hypothetical protein
MNIQIPEEFIKAMDVQNQNPVRVEKNSMQKNNDNDKIKSHNDKTRSYAVQLSSSTLIFSKINESPIPEAYQKQIIDQLCQMYHQVVTEELSSTSKDIALQIKGGDLSKASNPGARASSDTRKAIKSKPGGNIFAQAWSSNPSKRSRPAAANRLAQQSEAGLVESGNGLFGRFSRRSTPDPYNPGCAGGPKSITVLNHSKSSEQDSTQEITAHDGVKSRLTDKSLSHFTSKHGHKFGVDDPLPRNPNQKPTKFKQIRTRLNNENKAKVREEIKSILSNTKSDVYTDVSIRGIQGRVYHCKDTNRVVGIHTEDKFAGQIIKAQPISERQLELLREFNILD